jgi:hypothetical protein
VKRTFRYAGKFEQMAYGFRASVASHDKESKDIYAEGAKDDEEGFSKSGSLVGGCGGLRVYCIYKMVLAERRGRGG